MAVAAFVVKVKTVAPELFRLAGLKAAVTPAGKLEALRLTLPVYAPLTLMVVLAELFWPTVRDDGVAITLKLAVLVTVTVIVAL